MTTPDFILDLRKHIGHQRLWLTGTTAYVVDNEGRILLGQRADTKKWSLVMGIVEPGEQPADTVVREVKEETWVDCIPTDLVSVESDDHPIVYTNGDQVLYMDHLFFCKVQREGNSEPFVNDEESLKVGWFKTNELPDDLSEVSKKRMRLVQQYLSRTVLGDSRTLFTCTLAKPESKFNLKQWWKNLIHSN